MPGVPLDAFATLKKGLKGMWRNRRKSAQDEKHSQPTASSSEAGQTATTTAAPAPIAAPVKSEAKPVEMSSNEPVKIPIVECTRGQEATSGAAATESTTTTTSGTAPTATAETATAPKAPTSPNPEFIVTPPTGEQEPSSVSQTLEQDVKPGKYDGSPTEATATTKAKPAAIILPTSPVSDHDTSITTPKLGSERPASPAPKMSATSGPLDDHPNFV